jgi:hypothetical protein
VQNVTCSGTTWTTPLTHSFPSGANLSFDVTGGTSYGNLVDNAMYRATSTGSTTFTIQAFVDGIPSGAAVACGTAATGTVTVGWMGSPLRSTGATGWNANFQTLRALNSNWQRFGQALVAQFNGIRPVAWPNETANMILSQYEGAMEIEGPTIAQLNALGVVSSLPTYQFKGNTVNVSNITNIAPIAPDTYDMLYTKLITGMSVSGTNLAASNVLGNINFDYALSSISPTPSGSGSNITITATGNAATSIGLAIVDYKRSSSMQTLQYTYYNTAAGNDPTWPSYQQMGNFLYPAQLVLGGTGINPNNPASNLYGLQIGNLWGTSPSFKTRSGICQFNGVSC